MDVRIGDATATTEERAAIDALLGAPRSSWDGGARGSVRDAHVAHGGHEARDRRHLLLPALQALQSRVGWLSEGGLNYICERLTVPPADAWGVATFYAMLATTPRPKRVLHVCDDIACRVKGATALCATLEREFGPSVSHGPAGDHVTVGDAAWMHAPCLGLCDRAPAALVTVAGTHPVERSLGGVTAETALSILRDGPSGAGPRAGGALPADALAATPEVFIAPGLKPRLLARVGTTDPASLDAYREAGGFRALERALDAGGAWVIGEVTAAKLIGRGGAAFPTGTKWAAVAKQEARPHYLVCNADESEPGTFKDRVLLAADPFAVVESMAIAAFATGCAHGYVYLRAEYPLAAERMQGAIDQCRAAGLLGARVMGRDVAFDIEIRRGAGAYICGEETAIFESIEGKRGEPRNKPPYPVTHGLFGKPTVVNNVETLVNVLPIVMEGGAAFATVGTAQSTGTRLFCLSGCVTRPGVYEVPFGMTLGALIEMAGGVAGDAAGGVGSGVAGKRTLQAILLGGAAGGFVRADEMALSLTHEDTRASGTTLGSGVVMLFDDRVDLHDIILRVAAFFRDESCGQCVPCRVGTVRQEEALHRIARGQARGGVRTELALLEEIGVAMKDGSICGLGQTAYAVVESAVKRLKLYDGVSSNGSSPAGGRA